jgi:hypothetical protein
LIRSGNESQRIDEFMQRQRKRNTTTEIMPGSDSGITTRINADTRL